MSMTVSPSTSTSTSIPGASRRKPGDGQSWRQQLAPKKMRFRVFRAKDAAAPSKTDGRPITIVRHDPAAAQQDAKQPIPSDDECRRFLIGLGRTGTTPLPRSAWSDDDSEDVEDPGAQTDRSYDDNPDNSDDAGGRVEDEELWHLETMTAAAAVRHTSNRRTPEASSGGSTPTDDRSLKIRNYSIRGYSPHPLISEAKQMKMVKVDNNKIEKSQISPPLSRDHHHRESRRWSPRPSVASGLSTNMMRRPSRPEDALHSHPVQFHVRQDSGSDPLCRVCHVGVAERWGVCQNCEDDRPAPDYFRYDSFTSCGTRPSSKPTSPTGGSSGGGSQKRGSRKQPRPPPLNRFSFSRPNRCHQPSLSLASDPEANLYSEPPSPSTRTIRTVVTLPPGPLTPETPLSDLSTPDVYRRFERELGRALEECEHVHGSPGGTCGNDTYEAEWADYYFDKDNFHANKRLPPGDGPPNIKPPAAQPFAFRGGQRSDSVVHREVNSYMLRNLSLSEYEGAFASPNYTSADYPGPGWI